MTPEQPLQLRMNFGAPSKEQTLMLTLAGIFVLVEPDDGNYDLACKYLVGAGLSATIEPSKGLFFPSKELPLLKALPGQVFLRSDTFLAPLLELIENPPVNNLPATLTLDTDGALRLRWFDGNIHRDEPFSLKASPALLDSEISFVATSETWDELTASSHLPLIAGRASVNLDGYIEISATKPQLVESSPLPALFRVDQTHFGIPFKYANYIDENRNFVWEGHRPSYDSAPEVLPDSPLTLSEDSQTALKDMVQTLASQHALAINWDSGLGRRVFCLAALDALDAFPLLIVTHPAGLWAWQRHLDLFSRTYATSHDRADVHLVTYRDLMARDLIMTPQAVIFDNLEAALEEHEDLGRTLHRLDGVADAYRISVASSFPEDLEEGLEIMSILRPGEFRSDIAPAQRYPLDAEKRAREHIQSYISERRASAFNRLPFKRSTVLTLPASTAQTTFFEETLKSISDPVMQLSELLTAVSSGPSYSTSPKIAAAAGEIRAAFDQKRNIAVLTRHSRTAQLLKNMLRPHPTKMFDSNHSTIPVEKIAIVVFDTTLPQLSSYDEVLFVDYPWSTQLIERSVGSASDPGLPQKVMCLHLENSIDDRLALLASKRKEASLVQEQPAALTPEEIRFILAPRS